VYTAGVRFMHSTASVRQDLNRRRRTYLPVYRVMNPGIFKEVKSSFYVLVTVNEYVINTHSSW
jgi:hypothetical protein